MIRPYRARGLFARIGMHGADEDFSRIVGQLNHSDALVRWEAVQALQKNHDSGSGRSFDQCGLMRIVMRMFAWLLRLHWAVC